MVHENMVEAVGISTQSLMIRKKECEYFLFDFIPRDLKSSAAVQNKRMNLARVVQLPRGGRYTRRPETLQSGDVFENPSPQQTKDTRWKLRTTSEQVPFHESVWAMIALHHFLEYPELRSRIKNLLMDILLDTLRTTSRSLGASPRCPEISTSECNQL